ncbi:unnamed protein product [Acanthoscelides obtectus]|uniref:Uncharacterized protein n=1 Tax=Acanthoscelides obtectus TaxID=200917 RepID=A0A9P0JME8_ACAOB|nr:unnamed protein product [Acanthoscelides obtectus]CAK1642841.1 hypothetical protein AOBTE_LOCUS13237 [Acanthoscelides obtectus]
MNQGASSSSCNKETCQPKTCYSQPVMSCPWMTQQPHGLTPGTSKSCDPASSRQMQSGPDPSARPDRPLGPQSSLQTSSSHFFYFLRLMQLFPDTHPATLHTVLTLCKNDFFRAVDKLLYAKRCKTLYSRGMGVIKRCPTNRVQPYRVYGADYPRYTTLPQEKKDVPTPTLPVVNIRNIIEKEQEHAESFPAGNLKQHKNQEAPPEKIAPTIDSELQDKEVPLGEEEKAMIINDLSNLEQNVIDNNLDALESHDGFDSANGLKLKRNRPTTENSSSTSEEETPQPYGVVCLTSSGCSQLVPGDKIIFM